MPCVLPWSLYVMLFEFPFAGARPSRRLRLDSWPSISSISIAPQCISRLRRKSGAFFHRHHLRSSCCGSSYHSGGRCVLVNSAVSPVSRFTFFYVLGSSSSTKDTGRHKTRNTKLYTLVCCRVKRTVQEDDVTYGYSREYHVPVVVH